MAFLRRTRVVALITIFIITTVYLLMTSSVRFQSNNPTKPSSVFESLPDANSHWAKLADNYPVASHIPLPTGALPKIPKIQAAPSTEDAAQKTERLRRLSAVKESFEHSWEGYKKNAWLRDEVVPVAGGYRDTFGGWAATLVDALDTLWIMGMKEEFQIAVAAVQKIDFTTTTEKKINVFETNIRYLGGFLAAYDISDGQAGGYDILLVKAVEVGELLMSVFDTPNRMPISRWDWQSYMRGRKQLAPEQLLVSELGTLSLELTHLSQLTGDPKYYDAAQRVNDVIAEHQDKTKLPGMWPVVVDAGTPSFAEDNNFHFGGMSDSLYEYIPKQYLLLGGLLQQPRNMYEKFIAVAKKHHFARILNPENKKLLVSGEVRVFNGQPTLNPQGQHLTCFVGGMVAIAGKIFENPEEVEIGAQLADGCVWAYDSQVTGIAPEIFTVAACSSDEDCQWSETKWHNAIAAPSAGQETEEVYTSRVKGIIAENRLAPGFLRLSDKKYILRPEAIESVFILYRVTGDRAWQDKAWRMFEAVEKYTRTDIASSAINDVTLEKPKKTDSMESFWLAETLKYFYLCFAETNVVSLDEFVLNTEAHPLRRPT